MARVWLAVARHKWWGQRVALGGTGHRPGDQHGPNGLKCTELGHHPPKVQEGSGVSAPLAPGSVGLAVEGLGAAAGWTPARVRLAQLPSCLQSGSVRVGIRPGPGPWTQGSDRIQTPASLWLRVCRAAGFPLGGAGAEGRGRGGSGADGSLTGKGCRGAQEQGRRTSLPAWPQVGTCREQTSRPVPSGSPVLSSSSPPKNPHNDISALFT